MYPEFKNAIKTIALNPAATDDELGAIASSILGAWCSNDQKSLSVQFIVDYMLSMGKGHINIVTSPIVTISDKCRDVLEQIAGLNYEIKGSILNWNYSSRMWGEIPWSDELDLTIQLRNPATFMDLVEII